MFYEVRVLDSNNDLKKIITTKDLSRRHWMTFEQSQAQRVVPQLKKQKQKQKQKNQSN
jgi:hypothetical protein